MKKKIFYVWLLCLGQLACRPVQEEAPAGLLLSYPSLLSHYVAPPDLKLWFSPGCDSGAVANAYLCYGRDFMPDGPGSLDDSLLNLRWTSAWREKELPAMLLIVLLPPEGSKGRYLPAAGLSVLPDTLRSSLLRGRRKESESPLASFFTEELLPFLRARITDPSLLQRPRLIASGAESMPLAGALAAFPDSFASALISRPALPQIPGEWRKPFLQAWLASLPEASTRKGQLLILPEEEKQPLPEWMTPLLESDRFELQVIKGKVPGSRHPRLFELIKIAEELHGADQAF